MINQKERIWYRTCGPRLELAPQIDVADELKAGIYKRSHYLEVLQQVPDILKIKIMLSASNLQKNFLSLIIICFAAFSP